MQLTNYHTHTKFSDGNDIAENYVKEAINKKFRIIGFSEHSPIPFFSDWNMKYEDLYEYLSEIDRLKEKYADMIDICKGMEIDFIEGVTGISNWNHLKLDYTIGSVHFLRQFDDGVFFNFDDSPDLFAKGMDEVFGGDIRQLVEYYYSQVMNMIIKDTKPNIIGHFDLVNKFNRGNRFFSEDENWYRDMALEALEIASQSGCIVEVNSRGFYKGLAGCYYPNTWLIKECFNKKIPLTVNSDAHNPDELDLELKDIYKLLLNIGYKEIIVLKKNEWQQAGITENGLIIS